MRFLSEHFLSDYSADESIKSRINQSRLRSSTAYELKETLRDLSQLYSQLKVTLCQRSEEKKITAGILLQSIFLGYKARKEVIHKRKMLDAEWRYFVNGMFSEECTMKNYFLNASQEERKKFIPWRNHLQELKSGQGIKSAPL